MINASSLSILSQPTNFAMEINPSGLENSEHLIILGDDLTQNLETKSFRCSFCKRGFSNAQALGGHMNIHRKDRAKLLEFSEENLLSLEISQSVDSDDSTLPTDSVAGEKLSNENDEIHDEDDRAENIVKYGDGIPARQLPLFSEAAAESGGDGVSRKVELKCGEVDLELRLGPEPPHDHAN